MEEFKADLRHLINKHGLEAPTHTPDYILADYLVGCLQNYNAVYAARNDWHSTGVICVNIRELPQWKPGMDL